MTGGIGTYKERTLHIVLKKRFEPDTSFHEIKYKGYIADIMRGNEIIEIQTRAFNSMRNKLKAFLPDAKVTVVYPSVRTKWLNWIDVSTGEVKSRRKSPKTGGLYDIIPELYKIKMFLRDPNLTICIQPVDVEEYRNLDGWSGDGKKGSTRAERIPVDIGEPFYLHDASDYMHFLDGLPMQFTSSELAKIKKIPRGNAGTLMNIAVHVGAAVQVGKRGRAYLYSLANQSELSENSET